MRTSNFFEKVGNYLTGSEIADAKNSADRKSKHVDREKNIMTTAYDGSALKFGNGAELETWQIEAIVQNAKSEGVSISMYLQKMGWGDDQITAFVNFLEQ